jgi:hypothetical protein
MARDQVAAKFTADISVNITPVNQYGDKLTGGAFTYTVVIYENKLSAVMERLEKIDEK